MLILTCTEHTSTMSPELLKLRIMTISIKAVMPFAVNVYAYMLNTLPHMHRTHFNHVTS